MTESPASSVQHIAWTVKSDEERELRARHRNRRPLYKKKTLADAHCIAIRPCEAQHHTKAAINDYFGMKRSSRDHHCARGNWICSLSIMELANSRSTSRKKKSQNIVSNNIQCPPPFQEEPYLHTAHQSSMESPSRFCRAVRRSIFRKNIGHHHHHHSAVSLKSVHRWVGKSNPLPPLVRLSTLSTAVLGAVMVHLVASNVPIL